MRLHHSISLALSAWVFSSSACWAAPPATGDWPAAPGARLDAQAGGIASWRLDNGFRIILAPFPSAGSARVELLVRSGSKVEGYGETGMAHLLEHMLFKGAGERADLKRDLTALGARWNGTTSADRTNYFATVAPDPGKLAELIRIEADRFLRPRFTREDLASEMTVVRNELEQQEREPMPVVMRALQRLNYTWHGYGRPTIGARSDIEGAPFEALQAFHRRHYRPDNAALIVSGRFDPQQVLALAAGLFAPARNPDSLPPARWTREPAEAATRRSELALPAGTTLAASGWRLPGLRLREAHALDLASAAVCDPDWGSLRRELVLGQRLAARAFCGVNLQADYGEWIATAAQGREGDAARLSAALSAHVEQAAARGITAEQLERARREQLNAFERLRGDHEAVAALLSQAEVAGDWRLLFWQLDLLREISLDEANAALRRWLVAQGRSDVLLRHADAVDMPAVPPEPAAQALVAGRDWPALAQASDPLPQSMAELAAAVRQVELGDSRVQAVQLRRSTQGDLAWLVLGHDWGNGAALAGRQTACSMASQLLAYGGAGLDRDDLSARLEALRARWSLGLVGIWLEAPREQLAPALKLLLSVWADPLLPEAEFERLRAAGVTRLEAALQHPARLAAAESQLRFDNYPQGHPRQPRRLEQQLQELRALTLADVHACISDFGGLAQARLALVGDLDEQALQSAWQQISQLPPARQPYQRIPDPVAPQQLDARPIDIALPGQPNASISGRAVLPLAMESADYAALRLAVEALGGNADSRIWRRLREQEGLAYGAGASLDNDSPDPRSTLTLYASAASARAADALAALQDELARALRDGLSAEEVERARRSWLEARKTALRDEAGYAGLLAQGLLNGRDPAWLAAFEARIASVSVAQVNAALRRHLASASVVWATGRGS
jgi:zinc protease